MDASATRPADLEHSDHAAWNLFVFRKARESISGREFQCELLARLDECSVPGRDCLVNLLVRAGELECALADAGSPEVANVAAVVDELARLSLDLRDGSPAEDLSRNVRARLVQLKPPEVVSR